MATPNLESITICLPKILASSQMASGDNAVYVVPSNKAAKLATMTLSNVASTSVAVTVAIIPTGGSVDGTHQILPSYTILAGDSLSMSEDIKGMWLGDGDKINVNAASATAIDVIITGLEFS